LAAILVQETTILNNDRTSQSFRRKQLSSISATTAIAGLVVISCRKLRQVTRKPLYAELIAKNQAVRLRGSHYIGCPASVWRDITT